MNYIIDFVESADAVEIAQYLASQGATVIKEYDNFNKVYLVEASNTLVPSEIVESIIDDTATTIQLLGEVVANNFYGLPNPNLPSIVISTADTKDWWKNYVLKKPEFDAETVTISRKGSLSRVYVMDSGIDASHPEFVDANITPLFSFTGEFQDTRGHGTAIASVIAGKTCGLSDAQLQVVKVFDTQVATRQSDLLNAFDSILNDYLTNSNGLGIVNLSWSIEKNEYIESKIRTLIAAGMYVIVAAGNNGVPIENVTPASMPEVLTIGSFNEDLHPSNFSNYSNTSVISYTEGETNTGELDGWAPGEQIFVAALDGQYGYAAGTSIATAIHSCALAYNFSDSFLDGEFIITARNRGLEYISGVSLGHKDLLDLTDPKYSNSVNRFTTVINEKSMEHFNDFSEAEYVFTVGVPYAPTIFNAQKTKTVSYDALPQGFTLTQNGLLIGNAVLAEGVTHERHVVTLAITDLDDNESEVVLTLGIIAADFDVAKVPEGDPIIEMTLSDGWNQTCRSNGCRDDCEYYLGGYSTCDYSGQTKDGYGCWCT